MAIIAGFVSFEGQVQLSTGGFETMTDHELTIKNHRDVLGGEAWVIDVAWEITQNIDDDGSVTISGNGPQLYIASGPGMDLADITPDMLDLVMWWALVCEGVREIADQTFAEVLDDARKQLASWLENEVQP